MYLSAGDAVDFCALMYTDTMTSRMIDLIAQSIPDVLFSARKKKGEKGIFTYLGPGHDSLLGSESKSWKYLDSMLEVVHPDYQDAFKHSLASDSEWNWAGYIINPHGQSIWIEIDTQIISLDAGIEYHGIIRNHSQRIDKLNQRLQSLTQRLMQTEKLASLGQLTAGIAHEINNPINFVHTSLGPLKRDWRDIKQLIQRLLDLGSKMGFDSEQQNILQESHFEMLDEEITELIDGMLEGANRTIEIVAGLRSFSRVGTNEFIHVDIHPYIDSTLLLLKNKTKHRIEIIRNFGELPTLECQPDKMSQVFMNLLNNAIQAIPETGRIEIQTQQERGFIKILIKDSGIGIPPEIQSKMFDPFFTTKSQDEGTGLGLAITKEIIDAHQGKIEVSSKPGEGTVFRIYLPVNRPKS